MPEEIIRQYRLEDEAMLVRAEVIHDQLVDDLAAFTAKFPFIDAAYEAALQASIDAANALPLDNQVVDNLKVLTADVNAQVMLGRRALSNLGIYAKLTYPDDEARQRVFGQDKWTEAYNDQEKMMNALEQAHAMVTSSLYESDLAAKGFEATDAANLLSIAGEIRSRNNLQENAKNSRPVTTQDRIVQYNSVWSIIKEINLASRVVYADNPAKLDSYMLYPNSSPNTTVNITVGNRENGEPMVEAEVQIIESALAPRFTDSQGVVSFSSVNIPELISLRITSAEGRVTTVDNLDVLQGNTNDFNVEASA